MPVPDHAIEISNLAPPDAIGAWRQVPPVRPRVAHFDRIRMAAFAATAVLHVVVTAAWLAGVRTVEVPDEPDAPAGSRGDGRMQVTTVFFLFEPPDGEESVAPHVTDASDLHVSPSLALSPPKLDVHEETEEIGRNTAQSGLVVEGTSELERLRGLYVGQLEARVARVWEEELAQAASKTRDTCAVRVVQNRSGGVLEAQFERCPVDETLRLLLLAAIRRATPLPAPPKEEFFSPVVYFYARSSGDRLVSAALPQEK